MDTGRKLNAYKTFRRLPGLGVVPRGYMIMLILSEESGGKVDAPNIMNIYLHKTQVNALKCEIFFLKKLHSVFLFTLKHQLY